MSIEHLMFLWKPASYDRIECVERDQYGNPLRIRFLKKGEIILEIYVAYDENGEWLTISSERPKEEKKKPLEGYK